MIEKSQALKIINECAKDYNDNLKDRNVLFVYKLMANKNDYMESLYNDYNFPHLTGITISNKFKARYNNHENTYAKMFYKALINNKITIADFEIKDKTNAQQKLQVLKQLMKIDTVSRMVGIYNNQGERLKTEILTGNHRACLGYKNYTSDSIYTPNTALQLHGKSNRFNDYALNRKTYQVLAVFKKENSTTLYTHMRYIAKNINPLHLELSNNIIEKIMPKDKLIYPYDNTYENFLAKQAVKEAKDNAAPSLDIEI